MSACLNCLRVEMEVSLYYLKTGHQAGRLSTGWTMACTSESLKYCFFAFGSAIFRPVAQTHLGAFDY